MSEIDIITNLCALILMLFVIVIQGHMLGYLLTRKMLEYYDICVIKKKVPDGLCCCGDMEENHGYSSNHSIVYAVDYGIENAKKWERG